MPHHAFVHPPFALLLLSGFDGSTLGRVSDAVTGLSCIAIAAVLASFLTICSKDLPFRWALIAVTGCNAVAGLACLLSAVIVHGLHPHFVAWVPMVVAMLAVVCACVLPYLLPLLTTKSREPEAASLAASEASKSDARFLAVAQTTDDAFFLLNTVRAPDGLIEDFQFTYLNANAEKIVAKSSSEVVGARLTSILPIAPDGKLMREFRLVALTGKPLVHEFPLRQDDPEGPWMRHQVTKVDDGVAITASDITERKHAELKLTKGAQHDPLTGLPNQRLLEDRIEQAMVRADRYRNKAGVFLINLDDFESINKSHGRKLGDQIILSVANRLRAAIRATDTIIRLGGDEFILVMPDMRLEIDVRHAASALVAMLRDPFIVESQTVKISCSLGATIYPDTALTIQDLLDSADVSMCRAKMQGKNQYALYTVPTQSIADTAVELEDDLDFDSDVDQCAD